MTDTSTDPEPAVADTSFLYALFSAGDVFHEEARKLVGRGTPILVPPEIFAETIALIHYRQGFRAAAGGRPGGRRPLPWTTASAMRRSAGGTCLRGRADTALSGCEGPSRPSPPSP